jgi:hypothetical protein
MNGKRGIAGKADTTPKETGGRFLTQKDVSQKVNMQENVLVTESTSIVGDGIDAEYRKHVYLRYVAGLSGWRLHQEKAEMGSIP